MRRAIKCTEPGMFRAESSRGIHDGINGLFFGLFMICLIVAQNLAY